MKSFFNLGGQDSTVFISYEDCISILKNIVLTKNSTFASEEVKKIQRSLEFILRNFDALARQHAQQTPYEKIKDRLNLLFRLSNSPKKLLMYLKYEEDQKTPEDILRKTIYNLIQRNIDERIEDIIFNPDKVAIALILTGLSMNITKGGRPATRVSYGLVADLLDLFFKTTGKKATFSITDTEIKVAKGTFVDFYNDVILFIPTDVRPNISPLHLKKILHEVRKKPYRSPVTLVSRD